ncbi:MAG: nickel-dependent hydrogenase large subunit, partial [Thiomicrorhabdus sp.]|nr:nickel-dependent hydrogenase large subunit [Thiomicrorhabdus sp.]
KFIESGQLGPFKNGYWDNPAYKLSPEADLMALTHYLEALDYQKEVVKIHAVFGGKNPHPNYMVGGVPCAINMEGDMSAGAPVNMERLNFVKARIDESYAFNTNVYVPDVIAIAAYYKDWMYGGGIGATDLMDYGVYESYEEYALGKGGKTTAKLPGGVIIGGDWSTVHPVDVRDPEQIQEFVTHSWYEYPEGMEDKGLHPWDGITEANYKLGDKTVGTSTNVEYLDESAKYSWIKSPRWRGHAVEVGPLSRYILGYAQGNEYIVKQVDSSLVRFNEICRILDPAHQDVTDLKAFLGSTIGRTLARALESEYCAEMMIDDWHSLIENIKNGDSNTANTEKWDPSTWPAEAKGVGVVGAPRGAMAHWIVIKDGKIANYQCVVPTTWNGSPRDAKGNIGAFEAALMGTPMARPEEPVEILRTLHSFDPCLACSTHVMSEDGEEMAVVTVR